AEEMGARALALVQAAGLCACLFSTARAQEPPAKSPSGEQPPTQSTPPVPVPGNPAERQAWLRTRIDELLTAPQLKGARVGLAVMEVESGRILYAKNERTALNPASNAKLITTAAALALLGPEYRFKTALYADDVQSGSVTGNLYLKGFGDPSLVTE